MKIIIVFGLLVASVAQISSVAATDDSDSGSITSLVNAVNDLIDSLPLLDCLKTILKDALGAILKGVDELLDQILGECSKLGLPGNLKSLLYKVLKSILTTVKCVLDLIVKAVLKNEIDCQNLGKLTEILDGLKDSLTNKLIPSLLNLLKVVTGLGGVLDLDGENAIKAALNAVTKVLAGVLALVCGLLKGLLSGIEIDGILNNVLSGDLLSTVKGLLGGLLGGNGGLLGGLLG